MYVKNNYSCKVGIYLRLSRDDGDKAESDSIRNQRELIRDYVKENKGLEIVDEYADDGYSGTSFDRPAFQRMMVDINAKKINCVIVKDLSRLGRNYIETGRYIEKIFPAAGIRFISITDHYDSADEARSEDQIIIPFKNLINDAYCRDISIKIRSQLDAMKKRGQFTSGFPVYGYIRSSEDKHRLVIDEYAAEIIRMIFGLKLDGYSSLRIAARLNEMGVLPPADYKQKCGINYTSGFRSGSSPQWAVTTVNRVLTNETYTGTMVQGKTRKINYKIKQSVQIEEENWIRVENTHDAIIPKPVFETVQRLLDMDTRTANSQQSVYLFAGILKCGNCGQNMSRRNTTKKGKKYYYYHCTTYKKHDGSCTSHLISEQQLYKAVLNSIRQQVALVEEAEEIIAQIDQMPKERIGIKSIQTQIEALNQERERYLNLKTKLYLDLQEKLLTKAEYEDMRRRFSKKIADAEDRIAALEEKVQRKLSIKNGQRTWMDDFKKCGQLESLDRRVLISLVERIIVYDKTHIEIIYLFEDDMKELLETARQLKTGSEKDGKERVVV